MRTTLTLDPDVALNLKKKVETEKITLKEAVNQTLRAGLKAKPAKPVKPYKFTVEPHASGFMPGIDPDKLNQLLDELDVEEYLLQMKRDDNSGR